MQDLEILPVAEGEADGGAEDARPTIVVAPQSATGKIRVAASTARPWTTAIAP
jgi:hypothetical protein